MIVNLRGGNGSGKSYLVKKLLTTFKAIPESKDPKGKILGYKAVLTDGTTLGVLGSYENACGGCDGIHPYSEIWPRVVRLAGITDHVLFEGMSVSSSYGTIGQASEKYGDEFIFAFLNTPLDVCVENVQQRRQARGNTKELDPYNIVKKWRDVQRSLPVIRDLHKRAVVIIDYNKSLNQLLRLLHDGYKPGAPGPQFPTEVPASPRRLHRVQQPQR